jgi:hypothetical protein
MFGPLTDAAERPRSPTEPKVSLHRGAKDVDMRGAAVGRGSNVISLAPEWARLRGPDPRRPTIRGLRPATCRT